MKDGLFFNAFPYIMKAEALFGIDDAHSVVIVHRFALAGLQEGIVKEGLRLKRLSVFAHPERLSSGMPGGRVDDFIGNVYSTFAVFGFVAADGCNRHGNACKQKD